MDLARRWKLVVAEIGWPSIGALCVAAIAGIGRWAALILDDDPAWDEYFALYLCTILAASTLLTTLLFLSPFAKSEEKGTRLTLLVILSPVLLTLVVTAVITPPGVAMEFLGDPLPAVGVIAIVALLGVGATLCGLLVYLLLVFPVVLLVRAVRPQASRTASSALYEALNRRQLISTAIALPTIIGFAVFITSVSDQGGPRAARRNADVAALVTLTGDPGAIAGVVLCLLVLAAAIVFAVQSRGNS